MIVIALCSALLMAAGCGGGNSPSEDGCTEGRSLACSCPDGNEGRQVCQADGTWGACECDADPDGTMTDAGTADTDPSGDTVADRDSGGPTDSGGFDAAGDGDAGNPSRDWKTPYPDPPDDATYASPDDIEQVVGSLSPGDTVVLRDGTYPQIELEDIDGEPDARITIMAEQERQPLVRGDAGHGALRIRDSSYVTVQGIRFENEDDADADHFGGMPIHVTGSDHVKLWRNIARSPNLYGNNTGIKLSGGTTNSLVVENEVYDFHRNGISIHNGTGETGTRNNVVRRNYVNPRDTSRKGQRWGPNYAIHNYRGVDTIFENNIVEYSQDKAEDNQTVANVGPNARIVGNIVVGAKYGFGHHPKDWEPRDLVLANNVVLAPREDGTFIHSFPGLTLRNNTFIDPDDSGFAIDDPEGRGGEVELINNLVTGAGDYGYNIQDADSYGPITIDYCAGWNNNGTWGNGTSDRSNVPPSRDPEFADTYVYIPDDSPYAGAGKNGADVGANVLYRYENGELTDKPLWNPETGEFPHGAVIEGVNDEAGHSAFDVHERLGVSPQTLPDDY